MIKGQRFIKWYMITILCWIWKKYNSLCLVRSLQDVFLRCTWILHKLYTIITLIQKPVDSTCHSWLWVPDIQSDVTESDDMDDWVASLQEPCDSQKSQC